jgi:hypothetical protein
MTTPENALLSIVVTDEGKITAPNVLGSLLLKLKKAFWPIDTTDALVPGTVFGIERLDGHTSLQPMTVAVLPAML